MCSFLCDDRTVETQSGNFSESKKPGKSSEALLVASSAVLVLGWGDSGGAGDGGGASGGESGLMG